MYKLLPQCNQVAEDILLEYLLVILFILFTCNKTIHRLNIGLKQNKPPCIETITHFLAVGWHTLVTVTLKNLGVARHKIMVLCCNFLYRPVF